MLLLIGCQNSDCPGKNLQRSWNELHSCPVGTMQGSLVNGISADIFCPADVRGVPAKTSPPSPPNHAVLKHRIRTAKSLSARNRLNLNHHGDTRLPERSAACTTSSASVKFSERSSCPESSMVEEGCSIERVVAMFPAPPERVPEDAEIVKPPSVKINSVATQRQSPLTNRVSAGVPAYPIQVPKMRHRQQGCPL